MKKTLWVLLILCGSAQSLQFQIGPTYEVKEENPVTWLQQKQLPKLKASGELDKLEQAMQAKAKASVENPKGIVLPHTTQPRQVVVPLIKRVSKDIKDADGQVIIPKGTTPNPYQYLPESHKQMLFIDGTNVQHIQYALNELKKSRQLKVVLTQGKPLQLMRTHQVTFYFDQYQRLVRELDITHVPAKVYRRGSHRYLEEFVLPEDL